MIRTVLFDIDNTLYSYDEAHKVAFAALLEYAEKNLHMTAEEFTKLHAETMGRLKEQMGEVAATHNRLIRYQNMLESKGLPLQPHAFKMYRIYWDTLLEEARPSDGIHETMAFLKEKDIRIGIGTDMTAAVQFEKLIRLKLLSYIDFMVCSEEAGAEKPDKVFFDLCLKKACCASEECLFVGDSLKKDVLGARNAGMQAVWFRPQGKEPEQNIYQIRNMKELISFLS